MNSSSTVGCPHSQNDFSFQTEPGTDGSQARRSELGFGTLCLPNLCCQGAQRPNQEPHPKEPGSRCTYSGHEVMGLKPHIQTHSS